MASDLPTFDDVRAAAARLQGHAHRTPVLTSRTADAATGAQFFFKCENLQRMGAFKFRGAFNALAQFDAAQRRAGVVAFSSGNHAQAVALARLLGMPATIVMPHDAPAAKLAATRGYGAEVRLYDRYTEDREQIGRQLGRRAWHDADPALRPPHVIAGQGTAALELLEDAAARWTLFVPLGGGGLLSGLRAGGAPTCLRAGELQVFSVEPRPATTASSLREGRIVRIDAADPGRRRADQHPRGLHLRHHPRQGGRHPDRQRRRAGGGHALLRRTHEAGGGAHRLPGLRCRAPRG